MAFVKLDCGILDSTLWPDRDAREVFITALLMARPFHLLSAAPQIAVRTLEPTGFVVPPGWYGFIEAAGLGIVRRAGVELESGLGALERLGSPEVDSRSPEFEGRRLVRVAGGFIALNYAKYREKDHTAAVRSKRYRKAKAKGKSKSGNQIHAEAQSREIRAARAYNNGDDETGDRITAEGLPES